MTARATLVPYLYSIPRPHTTACHIICNKTMAPSRGLQILSPFRRNLGPRSYICQRCQGRAITTTPALQSGHNRWSKIKHDKAKADAGKTKQRSMYAQEIATASRLYGPDPNANSKLADVVAKARKDGFAKTSIEAAIARGQGRSASGASLENVVVEGILPGNIGVVVECETDNKLKTMMDVRVVLKEAGGRESAAGYLFGKKGRVVFLKREGAGVEQALEASLEAGATDVEEEEDDDASVVVWCEPGDTKAVGEALTEALGVQVTSNIVSVPIEETRIELENERIVEELAGFIDLLHEKDNTIQSVAMNVAQGSLDSDSWGELHSRLSA